jgi:hypothetical protein
VARTSPTQTTRCGSRWRVSVIRSGKVFPPFPLEMGWEVDTFSTVEPRHFLHVSGISSPAHGGPRARASLPSRSPLLG